MVPKSPQVSGFSENGQSIDGANPGDAAEELIIRMIRQKVDSTTFDLLALSDQAPSFG